MQAGLDADLWTPRQLHDGTIAHQLAEHNQPGPVSGLTHQMMRGCGRCTHLGFRRVTWLSSQALCNTAAVTFRESFWIVTGTAGPVIALAAVVSLTDAGNQSRELVASVRRIAYQWHSDPQNRPQLDALGTPLDALITRTERRAGQVHWCAIMLALIVAGQALFLGISLLSIAYQRNVFPVWLSVLIPVSSVLLLALTARVQVVAASAVRDDISRTSIELRQVSPE